MRHEDLLERLAGLTCELVVAEDQLGDVGQGDWKDRGQQVNSRS